MQSVCKSFTSRKNNEYIGKIPVSMKSGIHPFMPDFVVQNIRKEGHKLGAKDIKSNEYLADNARFADLFNYKLYDGEQVILPEDLQERDSAEILSILGIDEKEIQKQKWRDLLKSAVIKSTPNAFFVLLGVENQTEVHYAMPVRNMLYDALSYEKQLKEAKRQHMEKRDKMSSAEFLSGFGKEDKLTPIIPITLYWGDEAWDAPMHLHEMFGAIDEELLKFIPDYHVNLVEPSTIPDFSKFQTELGQTLEFIKYSKDALHLKEMLADLKDKKLSNETIAVINLFTGADIKQNEEGEVTDVCLAIEELKREAVEEAVEETMAKDMVDAVENIIKNFSISLEEACKGLEHTVEEYENAKKLLLEKSAD